MSPEFMGEWKRRLVGVAAWLVLAASIGAGGYLLELRPLTSLIRNVERTEGTVVELVPSSHGACRFSYRIGGRRYVGVAHPGIEHPSGVRRGDTVWVFYDRRDPGTAFLEHPRFQLVSRRWQVLGAAIGVPTLLVGLFFVSPKGGNSSTLRPGNDATQC